MGKYYVIKNMFKSQELLPVVVVNLSCFSFFNINLIPVHICNTVVSVCLEVKDDSSSVASSPDVFAVYLHLPYTGHTCFLFQQEEERDHFLSALKTCIRHGNLGKTQTPACSFPLALFCTLFLCWKHAAF